MAQDIYSSINPAQLEAVRHEGGPLMVVAGPGTGKTRVLTSRIAHMIKARRICPEQILAITFTNQAASEILKRVSKWLGLGSGQDTIGQHHRVIPTVATFHGWALSYLKSLPGIQTRAPIDQRDAKDIVREACRHYGIPTRKAKGYYQAISRAKQQFPPSMEGEGEEARAVFAYYQDYLARFRLWDFDDLILEALRMLHDGENAREFRMKSPFILVDEFQDVSPAQYQLTRSMAGTNSEITVIGDPNQAIYGFRMASPRFLKDFAIDFPDTRRIYLSTSYRCPQVFLDAASAVLEPEGEHLNASSGIKTKIQIMGFKDPAREARWIASTIEKLVGGMSFDSINDGTAQGTDFRSLSDLAVLFRARRLGKEIAKALGRRGIPFQEASRPDPLSGKDLRMLWRIYEILGNRAVEHHLARLPGDPATWKARIEKISREHKGANRSELLERLLDFSGIDIKDPAIQGILGKIAKAPEDWPLTLVFQREADLLMTRIEAVSLLSLHASKGLEFPIVFIAGCEDGIIPWHGSDLEEERRLFYVGITRASERLFMTYANKRMLFGKTVRAQRSRFIDGIPADKFETIKHRARARRKKSRQRSLF